MLTATITIALFIIVIFVAPRRRDLLERRHGLVSKMEPYDIETLSRFVMDDCHGPADQEFWTASNGIAGVIDRWRKMALTVRIVQLGYRSGAIAAADALHIWKMAALQTWFSMWSLPEAMLGRAVRSLPHIAARTALSVYCELAIRAVNLCVTEDAPVYIAHMKELL